nr:SAV_6107 family HEPN domain-containing protein [Virgisporangium aliadipatigenens]
MMATRRSGAPLTAVPTPPTSGSGRFPAGGPAAAPGVSARQELPVPAHALPQRTPRELLTMARRGLEEAAAMRPDGLRYATAHLSALRAAAAVLAARATPAPGVRRSRPTSVWTLLVMVAPELREWAAFFSATAGKRAAAEAGIPRVVTAREADDLMRSAEQFIAVVEVGLGFSYQPYLEGLAAS